MRLLKRSVSILLTLTMMIGILVIIPLEASAAAGVEYVECSWDSKNEKVIKTVKTCTNYNKISSTHSYYDLGSAWYLIDGDVTIEHRVRVTGSAHIILKSGTLTCKGGIHLGKGNSLYIYAAKGKSGTLEAKNGDDEEANIGGNKGEDCGTFEVHGGTVVAKNTDKYEGAAAIGGGGKGGKCGVLIFYDGTVTATNKGHSPGLRSWGAVIGDGNDANSASDSNCRINIYGGTISADNSSNSTAAAIGGGEDSKMSPVNILGGKITAKSANGAGIGSGQDGTSNTITIKNADVEAESKFGAGIGGGEYSDNESIIIENSTVKAKSITYGSGSGAEGAGIGGGNSGNSKSIKINKSIIAACSAKYGAGIGGGDEGSGGDIEITESIIYTSSNQGGAGIGGGDEKGCSTITLKNSFVVAVTDSGVNTTQENIIKNHDEFFNNLVLAIINPASSQQQVAYAAGAMTAMLIDQLITGDHTGSPIGSGDSGTVDKITIDGCVVTAIAGEYGAGIGGGDNGTFGTIDIKNSNIYAQGGPFGAGIGTGDEAKTCGTINITNSNVEAYGGKEAAGIGTGNEADGTPTINITDSHINAYGGKYAAAIGGGDDTGGGNTTIRNSYVYATGGYDGAGIGGGEDGNGGTIKIYDSYVKSSGCHYGSGIGGGEDAGVEFVGIYGNSYVYASAGDNGNGVAIGNGDYNKFFRKRPSRGTLSLNKSYTVQQGKNYYYNDDRWNVVWNSKYVEIYQCRHNPICKADNAYSHSYYCRYCGMKMAESAAHTWDDHGNCTECKANKDSYVVKYVERDDKGTIERTESLLKNTEFVAPDCTVHPDGYEFMCWRADNGSSQLPGKAFSSDGQPITFTAQYNKVAETAYINEEGVEDSASAQTLTAEAVDPNGNLALNAGWYAVEGQITAHSITMSGPVSLILKDGSSLTLKADVNDTDSTCLIDGGMLTVYGQKEQTGYILSRGASAHLDDLYLYGCSIDIQDRNGTSGAANKLEVEKQLIIRKGKLSCGSAKVYSLNYNGGVFAAPYGLDVQSCEPLRWESTKDYFMFKATGDLKDFSVYDGYAFVDIKGNKFTGSFSSEDVASLPSGSKKLEASLLHSYGKPEWKWTEDYKRATAVMTCKDCGEVLEIEAKVYAEIQGNRLTVHTAYFELFGKYYEDTVTTPTQYKIIMNVGNGGTASANMETAQYNDTVAISVSPDEGYTVKSVRAIESSGKELDVYKQKDGTYEFSVDVSDISVYVEFTEGGYHAMQEPYVNEQGEYILGVREHYEDDDGTCYYVYKDKSPRYDYVMEDVSLSYFIFQDNDDGTLRISRYTGPVTEDMTLEIPETFNGKKITVLGGGDSTDTWSDSLFISGDPVTIHLSKNITELKKNVFNRVKLKEVSGDTSGLRKISDYAFYKKSDNNYTTDIYLDYIGEIENDENGTWGRYQSSTTHLSHATTFKYTNRKIYDSVAFSFNDDHLYGEPEWKWSDDFSSAVLKVGCTHPLCRHTEEVNALVTSGVSNGIPYYVASAILDETTYTCIYQPAFEPFIDENGEYIPGAAEHFKSDGKNYAVNDDGTLGDVLDSVNISYFDFKLINNDSEYQINYYTGPTDTPRKSIFKNMPFDLSF